MNFFRPYWKFHNWIWINAHWVAAAGAISEIIPLHLFKWRESVNTISMGLLNHQTAFMIVVKSTQIYLLPKGWTKPLPLLKPKILALAMCDEIIDNFRKLSINFFISIIFGNLSIIFGNYGNYRKIINNIWKIIDKFPKIIDKKNYQ